MDAPTIRAVLVVDDDPAMAGIVREQVELLGFRATSVYDVETALGQLAEGEFQLVLSDLHMRPHGGLELLAAVRSRWPEKTVVLMSAFPAPDTRRHAAEAGALAFLSKPFSLEDLEEALHRAFPQP